MAAVVQIGRGAGVKVNDTTILYLNKFSIDDNTPAIEGEVFGDEFGKVFGMGTRKITGTIEGFLAIGDTTGQDVLYTAYTTKTKVSNIKFYPDLDGAVYWSPTGADAQDGLWVTSWPTEFDQASTTPAPLTINFMIGGSWARSDE